MARRNTRNAKANAEVKKDNATTSNNTATKKVEEVKVKKDVESVTENKTVRKKDKKQPKKVTLKELLEAGKNDTDLASIANKISRFIKIGIEEDPSNGPKVVGLAYDLFVGLKEALSTPNYNKFKKKLDYINVLFSKGKDSVLSPIVLCKYDFYWKHGTDSRMKYAQLIEFLSATSDVKERNKNLKRFNIDKVLNLVPENSRQNMIRYYNI